MDLNNGMLSNVLGFPIVLTYNGMALPLLCHSLEFTLMLGSHKTSDVPPLVDALKNN